MRRSEAPPAENGHLGPFGTNGLLDALPDTSLYSDMGTKRCVRHMGIVKEKTIES